MITGHMASEMTPWVTGPGRLIQPGWDAGGQAQAGLVPG